MRRRSAERLIRVLYPRDWRQRYGDELAELTAASSGQSGVALGLDLAKGGLRERLRSLVNHSRSGDRLPGGVLVVLWGWALFVIGGIIFQRFSEQWEPLGTAPQHSLPSVAYAALIAGAAVAAMLVVAGIAIALPAAWRLVRQQRLALVDRSALVALLASGLAAVCLLGLVAWAHSLSYAQRNGTDITYVIGFVFTGLAMFAAIWAWTRLACELAPQLDLSPRLVGAEKVLALLVSLCMAGMFSAVAVWWASLSGISVRGGSAGVDPGSLEILTAGALMVVAVLTGGVGTVLTWRRGDGV
jgi:hypothetical protein